LPQKVVPKDYGGLAPDMGETNGTFKIQFNFNSNFFFFFAEIIFKQTLFYIL
jgi:hypothetical protein